MNIKSILDNKGSGFGGTGVNFSGFTVGHKYLAVYVSNYWVYDSDTSAYIKTGATDIIELCETYAEPRVTAGGTSAASILTFTATAESISLNYGSSSSTSSYGMCFFDIT